MSATACVDTAIWDLIGKALNIPVCKLLGGYRDRLPIIAVVGCYLPGKRAEDLAPEMARLRLLGMAGSVSSHAKQGQASSFISNASLSLQRNG